MSAKRRIYLTFGLGAIMFVLIGFYAWYSANRYKEDTKWVTHTYEVISKAQNVLSYLQDMSSAYRSYANTGDPNYIGAFNESCRVTDDAVTGLKKMTSDNQAQRVLLDSITELIMLKKNYGRDMISARREGGFDKVKDIILATNGQIINQQNRDAIGRFINTEKKLLSTRLSKADSQFSVIFPIITASIILAVLLIIITLYYVLADYKKRVESEKKVRESETRIQKFLDVLPLGVFIFSKNGRMYYANSKSKEILGTGIVAEGDVKDNAEVYNIYRAGTNNLYPTAELPLSRALRGETFITIDDMEVVRDGVHVPMRVNATAVFDAEGKTEFAISVFEDITEAKKAEQELIKAKQMAEESSVLKEAFLANMSHEIRTPMNAIIGFTDILLKSRLEEKEMEYVHIIKSSGENLLHIINDILDLSKIEANMMTFDTVPMSIKELFHSIKITLTQKAGAKHLSLALNCEDAVPDILLGDATRLTQILMNLVDNAIKFTQQGSVTVSAVLQSENDKTAVVLFTVKDTGIGISEDKVQRIFERFAQAEMHTTRKYGGTGLGLSIAKQLVEAQGGEMGIKSKLNIGTEFYFTLPLQKTSERHKIQPGIRISEQDIKSLANCKILLAEDSSINIKLVLNLFSNYKIPVDVAENGIEAVNKLKTTRYDLVLMDMEMPEMNGYEAATVVRTELNNPVPIIAMTAHAMAGEKEKCLKLGMNDYISKPINADVLFEKMYKNIYGRKATDPQPATVSEKEADAAPAPERPTTVESRQGYRVISLDFLNEALNGSTEDLIATLEIFLTEFPKEMALLRSAVGETDYAVINSKSHKLRSTTNVLGMAKAEALLQEMEKLSMNNEGIARIQELNSQLQPMGTMAIDEAKAEKERLALKG